MNTLDERADAEERIDGAALLTEVEAFLRRFVAYPSDAARVAHALWIAHTHAMECWESTPRIAFLSPEPQSGKTRALEISELLVPRPVEAVSVTSAFLFRRISAEDGLPTILFDEVDTVFGPRAREHEDVRALLNAGHRRGAKAGRCAVKGREIVTEELPAFCAVALAGLGNLPDTILTRSIVIRMRRRSPQEKVTPYRRRIYEQEGHRLRDRLARWTSTITGVLSAASPTMPVEVTDRTADCWESLVTLADAAGGCWPEHARAAAVAFISEARDQSLSIGIRLLADLRTVFGDQQAMLTRAILRALVALDESPWASWKGKELDARALSSMLGRYGIKRFTVRVGNDIGKGYRRPDLHDAWLRYLPSLSPEESDTSGTSGTSRRSNCGNGAACSEAVTDVTDVTDFPGERDTIPF